MTKVVVQNGNVDGAIKKFKAKYSCYGGHATEKCIDLVFHQAKY